VTGAVISSQHVHATCVIIYNLLFVSSYHYICPQSTMCPNTTIDRSMRTHVVGGLFFSLVRLLT
jgi:hypothetical protein